MPGGCMPTLAARCGGISKTVQRDVSATTLPRKVVRLAAEWFQSLIVASTHGDVNASSWSAGGRRPLRSDGFDVRTGVQLFRDDQLHGCSAVQTLIFNSARQRTPGQIRCW